MTTDSDRIYRLLPGVIRLRDAEQDYPLRDLLRVVGEQADLLEGDIRRMYDNLFVETCEQWVVPYIGDLLGYRPLHPLSAECDDSSGARRSALLIPRRDVADTVALRRRKGTLSVLEDLAAAVAGWPAQVEERGTSVIVHVWRLRSYPLTRVRPFYLPRRTNCYTFSVLGNDAPLYTHAEPEDEAFGLARPHNVAQPLTIDLLKNNLLSFYGEGKSLCLYENGRPIDARRIVAQDLSSWELEVFNDKVAVDPERGRFMVPERYRSRGLTASYHYGFSDDIGGGEYARPLPSNTIGISLFRIGHLPGRGVPLLDLIRDDNSPFTVYLRGLLDADLLARLDGAHDASTIERQLCAELNRIMQAYDLSEGPIETLAIDDETARLLNSAPRGPRLIRLNRLLLEAGFPSAIARSFALVRITAQADRQVIMTNVRALQDSERPPLHMAVELADSGLYVEPVVITLPPHHTLELRAADGCRPTIALPERSADIDDMVITCGAGSRLVLDGLMVSRHAVRIVGNPAEVIVRHCTLVPGWELDEACEPCCGEEPSLVLSDISLSENGDSEDAAGCPPESPVVTHMRVERSIVGTILVQRDEVGADPVQLRVSDSIVDGTSIKEDAIGAPNKRTAHAVLCIARSTVIGITRVHAIELGENTIFNGQVLAARRQLGCLRFCYVLPDSRTPRRYACQPDLVMEAAGEKTPGSEAARVAPKFMDSTLRYGKPNYCRLADDCAGEIRQGADDEAEMGVYHDLYQPQRAANLEARLSEYLPLGWHPELLYGDQETF